MLPPWWLCGKESACNAGGVEMLIQFLGWEDPPEKEMPTHSTILAWEISWGCKELDMTERLNNNRMFPRGHLLN